MDRGSSISLTEVLLAGVGNLMERTRSTNRCMLPPYPFASVFFSRRKLDKFLPNSRHVMNRTRQARLGVFVVLLLCAGLHKKLVKKSMNTRQQSPTDSPRKQALGKCFQPFVPPHVRNSLEGVLVEFDILRGQFGVVVLCLQSSPHHIYNNTIVSLRERK